MSLQRSCDPFHGLDQPPVPYEALRGGEVGRQVPVRPGTAHTGLLSAFSTARVAGAGVRPSRSSTARAAAYSSTATTLVSPSTAVRSLRAADQPMETWSSCIADDGMESADAGTASRFSSLTRAAWVYWAIISPESTPASSARNGGSPWLRFLSSSRSVRRSVMDARSATAMARKSST